MTQGNKNPISKAMFALILHTLQEIDSEEKQPIDESKEEYESSIPDKANSYKFIEI